VDNAQTTCWTIIRAAAGGDDAARATFSRDYGGAVRKYLERRWSGRPIEAEVEDAAQEVFVECLKPRGVLERADAERGDFRGFLHGVTRNVARRFENRMIERGRIYPEESNWLLQIADDDAGQATLFDRGWAQTLMEQATQMHRQLTLADGESGLRRLELLERRFGNDEALRDIAEDWGVAAQDVHNQYRKARIEFYRCLREVVGAHAAPGKDLDKECRRLLDLLG